MCVHLIYSVFSLNRKVNISAEIMGGGAESLLRGFQRKGKNTIVNQKCGKVKQKWKIEVQHPDYKMRNIKTTVLSLITTFNSLVSGRQDVDVWGLTCILISLGEYNKERSEYSL